MGHPQTRTGHPVAAEDPLPLPTMPPPQAIDAGFPNIQHFLLDAIPDSVIIVDGSARIVHVNAVAEREFGYSSDEMLGQAVELLLPDRLHHRHVAQRNEYFAAPVHRPMAKGAKLRGKRRDGTEFPAEVSLSPLQRDGRHYVVCVLRDITEREVIEQELARAALLDKLTGLPNRSLFLTRLQMTLQNARRTRRMFAVMFLDFDRFKVVNDCLGHDVGDLLLKEIAGRLRGHLRCADTVSFDLCGPITARLGGDEFVILLDEISGPDDVAAIAQRLLVMLSEPYRLGPHEVFSTASIGIVVGDAGYERAEDVVRDADTAMYEAKRAGRGRFVVFDEVMRQRAQRRHWLENDLRNAIEGDQLTLEFQPIVSLTTGAIASVEALLRWWHPGEGVVSPCEFIPIAEESELIHSIGDWVLRAGCRQMADWIARLGEAAPPTISINLSRKQFVRNDLPEHIRAVLRDTGLPAHRVRLEVTEDAFASDVNTAIAAMNAIKNLGVQLAIDDFGTGCSSFACLHQFPADVLKLDRSMLAGVEDSKDTAALVHSLAILVGNLGMAMVAEGVEKESQVIALQELGCQYGQGFYFSKPIPATEFEEFVLEGLATGGTVAGAMMFQNLWSDQLKLSQRRTNGRNVATPPEGGDRGMGI